MPYAQPLDLADPGTKRERATDQGDAGLSPKEERFVIALRKAEPKRRTLGATGERAPSRPPASSAHVATQTAGSLVSELKRCVDGALANGAAVTARR